jgi:hypothetical protein
MLMDVYGRYNEGLLAVIIKGGYKPTNVWGADRSAVQPTHPPSWSDMLAAKGFGARAWRGSAPAVPMEKHVVYLREMIPKWPENYNS